MNRIFFFKNLIEKNRISIYIGQNYMKSNYNLTKTHKIYFSSDNNSNKREEELSEENLEKIETKIAPFQEKPLDNKDQEDSTLKQEGMPLIQYSHHILPFAQIINKNFNRKELLFNLALKYGKITQLDDETTQIDDIVLYKDDKKLNKDESFNYGILCQIKVKKNNYFIIEALDKILQIKSTEGFGKYRFFKPHHATEIFPTFTNSDEYYYTTLNLLKDIVQRLDFVKTVLSYEDDNFGNIKYNFNFEYNDIKLYIQKHDYKVNTVNDDPTSKEIFYQEYFLEIYKYISYFAIKLNFLKSNFFQTEFDFNKYFQTREILEKLQGISSELNSFCEFLELKYEKYGFKFSYQLNFENPFKKSSEDDVKRLQKYKQALEHKIKDVDNIEKLKEDFRVKISKIVNMTSDVKSVLDTEINKISGVNFDMENTKRIDYINHVLNLPWDNYDEPIWDINYTKEILDKNMYGLNETKNRIYEYIAKNQRNSNKKGCVILLHGGPGTGKTRIAKLIGEAMKRKVGFISLAGESDSKNLLGHKRLYMNSCPGVFIKELQKLGTKNPVIVIDEIDKVLSQGSKSSVFYALLQILNPEESHKFVDHYLEIPFDFSNVIFILTSNNSGAIFHALIDRMESFEIDPYIDKEKFYIAKNYMVNQIILDYGFNPKLFKIKDETLLYLIEYYCKNESGVRSLNKLIESIVRKICFKIEVNDVKGLISEKLLVNNENPINENDDSRIIDIEALKQNNDENSSNLTIDITPENVKNLIKYPNPSDEVLTEYIRTKDLIGSAVGLTVSSSSQSNSFGDAIKISLVIKKIHKYDDKKIFKQTKNSNFTISTSGKIKDIFKQSLEIALNVATYHLTSIDYKKYKNFFIKNEIHFHIPDMLVEKDGPSAGIGLYLCAMSLALNKPLRHDLALTGEISFDGSVLKIGGVRQKCQGALRYNIKHIILPMGNKDDFDKLPNDIKDSFQNVYFVNNYLQVYKIAFNIDDGNVCKYDKVDDTLVFADTASAFKI